MWVGGRREARATGSVLWAVAAKFSFIICLCLNVFLEGFLATKQAPSPSDIAKISISYPYPNIK